MRPAALLAFLLAGCQPLISPYDHIAYQNATSLKAQVLALADRAAMPYKANEQRIEAVQLELDKAHEYAAGMASNQVAARQWALLKDPEGDLFGGFVRTWRAQGTLSKAYVAGKRAQLARAFDDIICLEANKRAPTECAKAGAK